jgi:hypothetical protein
MRVLWTIKLSFGEIWWRDIVWIRLAHDTDQFCELDNKPLSSVKVGEFLDCQTHLY